jgi:hypothetical protein
MLGNAIHVFEHLESKKSIVRFAQQRTFPLTFNGESVTKFCEQCGDEISQNPIDNFLIGKQEVCELCFEDFVKATFELAE